ncbi:hypothetical protein L596_027852 [Steinernema carpocapsae]|uniref:Uncharacterized protein n=1 Tax=Steinernema carpocapsae TaxID=34508 RepID=A0A4U5LWS5_STECR|nr:hypothetical protein L596_027852 [Steinernema carpocapsae]
MSLLLINIQNYAKTRQIVRKQDGSSRTRLIVIMIRFMPDLTTIPKRVAPPQPLLLLVSFLSFSANIPTFTFPTNPHEHKQRHKGVLIAWESDPASFYLPPRP